MTMTDDKNNSFSVLIVDDDQNICELLLEFMTNWGIRAKIASQPAELRNAISSECHDVFLLDVLIEEINGLDFIPEITRRRPNAKIIIMTGYADKEVVIKALKLGAFDFLEKPFQPELLRHSLDRALETIKAERAHKKAIEELRESQAELLSHKEHLEYLNTQLMETNKALSVLAQNIERERVEMEKRIALKLKNLVIPTIEKMRRDELLAKYSTELDILVKQIDDLTSGFSVDAQIASTLTFTELKIASLIKNGLTTEEIADRLNIAFSTVRTHRKNIRRKLKINKSQYSLRNYLLAKSDM